MTFNTTSFLAGVGTVFAAVALGFAGGAMITTQPRVEPNRLERVTATAPAPAPDASVKAATPEVRSVVAAKAPEEPAPAAQNEIKNDPKNEMTPSPAVPERVASQASAPVSQQPVPPQSAPVAAKPVVAKDDADSQADSPKKARDDQPKRESASRNAERRAERRRERRQRDLEGVEDAVMQIQPDDAPRQQAMPQRYERGPRFGFFGDN